MIKPSKKKISGNIMIYIGFIIEFLFCFFIFFSDKIIKAINLLLSLLRI